jgi:hypothetical protein
MLAALQLLDSVHALLRSGRSTTQRDVYYNVSGSRAVEMGLTVSSRPASAQLCMHQSCRCKHTMLWQEFRLGLQVSLHQQQQPAVTQQGVPHAAA